MRLMLDGYLVDTKRAEIVGPKGLVHVERLPFKLVVLLITNRDRVVSRSDLIEKIWDGRIVSEATISTAIKQARKAIGDNGTKQSAIKTVHGLGYRFVAEVKEVIAAQAEDIAASDVSMGPLRTPENPVIESPCIAVMKFTMTRMDTSLAWLTHAMPSELLSGLSRMRWLHVISRGSSFQFDPGTLDPVNAGARLGVRYVLMGSMEASDTEITVSVELAAAQDGKILWSETFTTDLSGIQTARQRIVSSVVGALELELPAYEATRSRRLAHDEFDAWSHFHVGLSHLYKFREDHNQSAAKHFDAALKLDPGFARAHAGQSFTHWQTAFMQYDKDREQALQRALKSAELALEIDPLEPFANFNMGRARWLQGDIKGGEMWLDRALSINPNFAQSHYSKGLMQLLDGKPDDAIALAKRAMSLSPLDPISYAMLSVQALSKIAQEDFVGAGKLIDRALQTPSVHFYINLIAACVKELEGNHQTALHHVEQAKRQRPDVTSNLFFGAFPFRDGRMRRTISDTLGKLGLD
ncbi:winged helix-turn-helix domain-containing tetratricopeptide repeat protein [Roseobacter sp. EG26]|uniref:winged helix-turn-helix domain-containing tetratricopeptide repeat protein n=1 Tax=Roseobacter sp. EG26 TaxID=3412477 RepID=UPI003CE45F07